MSGNDSDDRWLNAVSVDNILLAAAEVFGYVDPGKYLNRLKPDQRQWWLNRHDNAPRVSERMKAGYVFGEYKSMRICEPKPREINYHKDLDDTIAEKAVIRACEESYYNAFARSSFGSIKGRGLIAAKDHVERIVRNHPNAYYVQTDCRHYYAGISHEILKAKTRAAIPSERCADFMCRLIDSFPEGIPIGIPSGHYSGNLMLADTVKAAERMSGVLGVAHNMDDIIVVTIDRATARRVLKDIVSLCQTEGLEIKPNHRIAPVATGIDAFGYVTRPTHTRVRKRMRERMKRKLRRLVRCGASDDEIRQQMASYYGWCKFADARHLLVKVFGEKLKLYDAKMKIQRRKELIKPRLFFGLERERFVSINALDGVEVLILEVMTAEIRGETKTVIRLCPTSELPDEPTDEEIAEAQRYTITKSAVIADRLSKDSSIIPFAATVRKVKNRYFTYE